MIIEQQIASLIPGDLILVNENSVLQFTKIISNGSELYKFEVIIRGIEHAFCNVGDNVSYSILQFTSMFDELELLSEEKYKKLIVFK